MILRVLVILGALIAPAHAWRHGQAPASGPQTASNPFVITTPSATPTIGATISPRASGGYRTSAGTSQSCGTPTAFAVDPSSSRQWLTGSTACNFSVVQSATRPLDAIAELYYPDIQGPITTTIATGDGVTTTFAALGGTNQPGGGVYSFLELTPLPGSITLTAGAVTGTDGGLSSNGTVAISGTGISSGSIRILQSNTYADGNVATHRGYYTITFSSAPALGVPIDLTYRYTWTPPSVQSASPSVDPAGTVSMWRLLPSVDDTVAAARATAFATGSLSGSGIAVLDPAVVYGIPPGQTTAQPCVDMALDCFHSGANTNYPAVQAACPDNTVGNTYSWTASTKQLRFTAAGSSGNNKVYCGFDLATSPAKILSLLSFVEIKYNDVLYNVGSANSPGIDARGSSVNIHHNRVRNDPATYAFNASNTTICISSNNSSSGNTSLRIANNDIGYCAGDGINLSNYDGWEVIQNKIGPVTGFPPGSHGDSFQTPGVTAPQTINGTIQGNYIQNFTVVMAQTWPMLYGGKNAGGVNGTLFLDGNGTTGPILIDSNFLDGGVRNIQFSGATGVSLTNNIYGTNQVYAIISQGGAPAIQTSNWNAYSGAIYVYP